MSVDALSKLAMNRKSNIFVAIILTLLAFNCNLPRKAINKKKSEISAITPKLSYCDSVQNFLIKDYESYKMKIVNIDPKKHVYTTLKSNKDTYQIDFTYNSIFNKFEVWINDIKFDFQIGSNDCRLDGDNVQCFVNQEILGRECLKRGYAGDSVNSFDCIYGPRWTIKVRGKICDSVFGPFSDEINKVSLQCKKPEE